MVGFTSEQEPCSLCGEKPARVWVWPGQSRECRRPEDPSVQGRCGGEVSYFYLDFDMNSRMDGCGV